jgi:hypothetical protein
VTSSGTHESSSTVSGLSSVSAARIAVTGRHWLYVYFASHAAMNASAPARIEKREHPRGLRSASVRRASRCVAAEEHDLVAGPFRHALQRRVRKPDRQRLPFTVVEAPTATVSAKVKRYACSQAPVVPILKADIVTPRQQ